MAKDTWASVFLIVGSTCAEADVQDYHTQQGLTYFSAEDFLVLRGYWSWTSDEYHALWEFDSEGMLTDIRPCPHDLPMERIGQLRTAAREALAAATTNAERRVAARIEERLTAINGSALESGPSGCTDLPPDWHKGGRVRRHDHWTNFTS